MSWRNLILSVAFLLAAVWPAAAAQQANPGPTGTQASPAPYTRHVFLVVVKGLSQQSLAGADAPNLKGLANAGVQFKQVGGVEPDTLAAACATLVSGLDPSRHGFVKAGDSLSGVTLPGLLASKGIDTSLVGGGDETAGLWAARWEKPGPFTGDQEAMDAEIAGMNAEHPYFNFIVLDGPASKTGGLSAADTAVGKLLQYLHQYGLYNQSIIVVTGTGDNPPLILRGWQLKEGAVLPAAGLVDVAPTLAELVGVKLPAAEGLVLWDALKAQPGENELYLLSRRLNDLSLALLAGRQQVYDLQANERQVNEEKARVYAERDSYGQAIKQRDEEIDRLHLWIKVIRSLSFLALAAAAAGYLVLYRVLKKKFLFFT
ncbi:MAG TPA: alkaline phosphatase family protein [Spirochaetia bacterium]|nr:alkaline phosphatase family protein [Spirochaetia bacterium]